MNKTTAIAWLADGGTRVVGGALLVVGGVLAGMVLAQLDIPGGIALMLGSSVPLLSGIAGGAMINEGLQMRRYARGRRSRQRLHPS